MADDRAAACAGEAAVGDERHAGSQLRVGADGLAGVEHLGHAAAAGAFVTDEDGISGLDLLVQNGADALFLAVKGLCAQGGVEHVLGAGGVLDDTALRGQIALQDSDAAVGALGVVKAVDDILAGDFDAQTLGLFLQDLVAVLVEAVLLQVFQVFAQRLAGDSHHVQMQHGLDLFHHAGHAACIVEVLCGPVAGRTDVQQIVCAAVHPVKGVGIDLKAELVGDGGQMHGGIGGAGDGGVHHDGIFKALHGDDVLGLDALGHQLHHLNAGIIGSLLQLRGGGRHQGGAGQHQAQRLGHDLHGGSGAHEGAGTAAGAGVVLVVVQLFVGDDAGLFPCIELADLFQRQQVVDGAGGVIDHVLLGQGVGFHHAAGDHDGAHILQAANAHQHGRHGLVAAGDEHAAVVHGGVGLSFHQIHDGITVGQRVVDAVVALCDAVAHIGCKIACSLAAVGVDCLYSLLHELIQMGAAGVAVAKGALHHDLGLCKVVHLPAHADLQRIVFRCQFTHCLRTQFHDHTSKMLFFCFANRPFDCRTSYMFILIDSRLVCKLSQSEPTL